MNQPEIIEESENAHTGISSPDVRSQKREWSAPSVEEFDFTATKGAINVGADIGIYS